MSGFFSTAYYCEKCEFAYSSLSRHYCDYTCKNCLTRPACVSYNITQKTCTECNKTCSVIRNTSQTENVKMSNSA